MSNYERRDFEAHRINKLVAQEEFKEASLKAQESLKKLLMLQQNITDDEIEKIIEANDLLKSFGEKEFEGFLDIVLVCTSLFAKHEPKEVREISRYAEILVKLNGNAEVGNVDIDNSVRGALKTLERRGKVKCLKAPDGYHVLYQYIENEPT